MGLVIISNVLVAFLLTIFAGLATGIGSFMAFFSSKDNRQFLSISLGFSAGVMVYVSFVELLTESREMLVSYFGTNAGEWAAAGSFFAGIFLVLIIDNLVPDFENPHQPRTEESIEGLKDTAYNSEKLKRMGLFSAAAIAVHNFPEGIATFASALSDPALGLSIAVAVAIHNIPEGLSVSVPLYYSTGSKRKAFFYSFLSGFAEPLGAVVGYFALKTFFNDLTFGLIMGSVAGIMVYISIDELLPASREYGKGHQEVYGFFGGMVIMALSLLIL